MEGEPWQHAWSRSGHSPARCPLRSEVNLFLVAENQPVPLANGIDYVSVTCDSSVLTNTKTRLKLLRLCVGFRQRDHCLLTKELLVDYCSFMVCLQYPSHSSTTGEQSHGAGIGQAQA